MKTISQSEKEERIRLCVAHVLPPTPAGGETFEILTTADPAEAKLYTSTHKGSKYSSKCKYRKLCLTWKATVQDSWERSVFRPGLATFGQYAILFAKKLATKHWETWAVVAVRHGLGFNVVREEGFLFRLGAVMTYHTDRAKGAKYLTQLAKRHALAVLAPII